MTGIYEIKLTSDADWQFAVFDGEKFFLHQGGETQDVFEYRIAFFT